MAKKKIIPFIITLFSLIILDFIVISNFILPIYKINLINSIRLDISLFSSLLAWLLISVGIFYFVTLNSKNKKHAFKKGAILGLVIYGAYDLTNYAILKDWTLMMSITDIIWGMILCATISLISKHFYERL